VQGDKYLARIIKTFPPRTLTPPQTSVAAHPEASSCHYYASDLTIPAEEVILKDDPMDYFYSVRLIEAGAETGADQASVSVTETEINAAKDGDINDAGEKWQGSMMELQADKIR
jgi:bromodomain adjacent to zinc finger domain protein 1A